MPLSTAQIQQAYVTFFSRPADPAGLGYWTSYPGGVADLYATFAQSSEYSTAFNGLSSAQRVNLVYQNMFGRDAEPSGLLYWARQLDGNAITVANLALAVSAGSQGTDASIVANRVTAATSFTNAVDTSAEILGYTGASANASAKAWLATVKDTAASLTAATAGIDAAVAGAIVVGGAAGSTFTATTGVDSFTGGAGSDTFNAFFGTAGDSLGAGDTFDGGAGNDTLNLTTTGAAASSVATTVRNIETINIRGLVTSTFDATSVTGANAINVIDSVAGTTATVQGLRSVSTVIGATGPGAITATHTNASLGGTADTAMFSVTGAGAGNTAAVGAASNAVTAAITASTTGIEGYSFATSGTNIFSVTGSTTALTDGGTLTITGNGSNTITASALTNAKNFDLSASTGTNTLNLAGNLGTSDVIKGGTGADTLRVANTSTFANLTVTGVENLRISTSNTATGNMVFATAPNFTTIRVDGDTAESGTQTATGIGNTLTTINYVGDSLTANSTSAQQFNNITIANSLTGTETVGVTIGNGTIVNTGGYTLRTLTPNGAENLNITANDLGPSATATFTGITDNALSTISVTAAAGGVALGNIDGTTAAGTSGSLALLDFSKVVGTTVSSATLVTGTVGAGTVILGATGTGGTTLTLGLEVATDTVTYTGGQGVDTVDGSTGAFAGTMVVNGLAGDDIITGGAGGDTFDGGTGADTLSGNNGADSITGGEGADIINGGNGNDTIILTESVSSLDTVIFGGSTAATSAGLNRDTVTGFTSADRMQFGSTFLNGANTFVSNTLVSIDASTVQGMSANSGLITLVSNTLAGASGSAAISGLLAGTSGFSVAGSQTAVIVAADGSNAYVWYVNDGFDTNALVSSADIVLIGTLSGTTSVAAFTAANFAATIAG